MKRLVFSLVVLVSSRTVFSETGSGRVGGHAVDSARESSVRPKFCAALRGNGNYIFTHFAALARLSEAYGTFDGMAGGSSGSVSAFFYESMALNPAVSDCGSGRQCSALEQGRRVAFLLKSMDEYLDVLKDTPEARAIFGLANLYQKIQQSGVGALVEKGAVDDAGRMLKTLLENDAIRDLVNPKIWRMLDAGRVSEVINQVKEFGKFEAKDPSIFFRPGLIDFDKVPGILGRIADFYAGRGTINQTDQMIDLLNRCAVEATVGKWWDWIQRKKPECASQFRNLLKDYRKKNDFNGSYRRRIRDPIGGKIPTLVSTSVVKGADRVDRWRHDEKEYLQDADFRPRFDVNFSDVRYGYWGRPQDLKLIEAKFESTTDLKAAKFLPLGPKDSQVPDWTPWEDALRTSPAEPGLSAIQPIDGRHLSLGGWSDLQPVAVLKAMGCENVIYITREGPESPFALGVAKLLGMSPDDERRLFELGVQRDGSRSSFQESINQADGVWCTQWDGFTASQIIEMTLNSFRSPLVVPNGKNRFLNEPTSRIRIRRSTQVVGCAVR